jgi:hypothetical protein
VGMFVGVSTITAILEPDADGTLHLPLPLDLRKSRVRVTATLEADDVGQSNEGSTREAAIAALKRLRARGTFREISDPVAWQREIRRDRPLPGREG